MNVIEMDAASNNGVDDVRIIRDEVTYAPTDGRYKVYTIDEAHNLSNAAFNALLKTLEEPPSYVIFILATTEYHKIPITILSRCQRYDFKRIAADTIVERLHELMEGEGIEADERALAYIAKAADGGLRDALSLFDQCSSFYYGQKLTYDKVLEVLGAVDTKVFSDLLCSVMARDIKSSVELLGDVVAQGRELNQFVTDPLTFQQGHFIFDHLIEIKALAAALIIKLKLSSRRRYQQRFADILGKLGKCLPVGRQG